MAERSKAASLGTELSTAFFGRGFESHSRHRQCLPFSKGRRTLENGSVEGDLRKGHCVDSVRSRSRRFSLACVFVSAEGEGACLMCVATKLAATLKIPNSALLGPAGLARVSTQRYDNQHDKRTRSLVLGAKTPLYSLDFPRATGCRGSRGPAGPVVVGASYHRLHVPRDVFLLLDLN